MAEEAKLATLQKQHKSLTASLEEELTKVFLLSPHRPFYLDQTT
jgi:hypothetical protein